MSFLDFFSRLLPSHAELVSDQEILEVLVGDCFYSPKEIVYGVWNRRCALKKCVSGVDTSSELFLSRIRSQLMQLVKKGSVILKEIDGQAYFKSAGPFKVEYDDF